MDEFDQLFDDFNKSLDEHLKSISSFMDEDYKEEVYVLPDHAVATQAILGDVLEVCESNQPIDEDVIQERLDQVDPKFLGKCTAADFVQACSTSNIPCVSSISDFIVPVGDIVCNIGRSQQNILQSCTRLGDSLANNLIRIAATRIFADPYQSILELPVNSIDSYNRMQGKQTSIGKFGMGFFSILYWLFANPNKS